MSYIGQKDFALEVVKGSVPSHAPVSKFGRNDSVGTTFVPIALGSIYQTPQVASATTLRIKAGGNANDTAAGTGAREVTLQGLDETGALVSEAVATAGASASSVTTATFLRLYRAFVSSSGTYATSAAGSHAADIVIENGAGGTDWLTIDSTNFRKGQSEVGAYSVPSGKTAYVKFCNVTIDSGKTCELIFFHRGNILETAAPYTAMRAKAVLTGLIANMALAGRGIYLGGFAGPCDIGFMGRVTATTGSMAVEFEMYLVDD